MNALVTVYIGVGSNQDDPALQCRRAGERIAAWPETRAFRSASLYRTEAHLRSLAAKAPWYVNTVFEIKTSLAPQSLFERLQTLEIALGRKPEEKGKWLPRPIDLDILCYDGKVLESDVLSIPHPRIAERRFVLLPLSELAPCWVHPGLGRSIQDLLQATLDDKAVARLCSF